MPATATTRRAPASGAKRGAKRKKDKAFFQAIGRKGGQKTREKYGSEFFQTIGRRGGTALKEEKGVEFFRAIARISRRKAALAAEA